MELYCNILSSDSLTYKLLSDFIRITPGLYDDISKSRDTKTVLFVDADDGIEKVPINHKNLSVVVVSSKTKHVKFLFDNQISDCIPKADLDYTRFSMAIEKIRSYYVLRTSTSKQ